MEYPGFYFDPKTKRLYREPNNGGNQQRAISEREKEIDKANISTTIVPKSKNFLSLLRNRELGIRRNVSIESPLLKLKTEVEFGNTEDLTYSCDKDITNVAIVRGGHKSIFGMWNVKRSYGDDVSGLEDVVCEVFLESKGLDRNCRFGKVCSLGVQDFCDGFEDSELLMILSNCYRSKSGRVMLLYRHRREGQNIEPARLHMKRSSVFCCCSNSFMSQFAVGCEFAVSIESSMGSLYNIAIKGNVHALHYNQRGNALYCGTNSGQLSVLDMRNDKRYFTYTQNLFSSGLNELLLLSNEKDLICGSFNGDLVKVDLRMKRMVAEYLNHSHSTKKSPVSVNESLNLLCATGVDNVTRLWSLEGGVPVRVIRPPDTESVHKSWLLDDPWGTTLHLFQKNCMYKCKI